MTVNNGEVSTNNTTQVREEEIDLKELFKIVWEGKWFIVLATLISLAAGIIWALSLPNTYTSSVVTIPVSEDETVGRINGSLGSLANLAGLNIGAGQSNRIVIAKEVIRSHVFLTEFIHKYQLTQPIAAVKGWDHKNDEWIYNQDIYDPKTKQWLVEDGESLKPTDWELVEKFREEFFVVSENKDTGVISVHVTSFSPSAAKSWAEALVNDLNGYLREKDVKEARSRIAYLEKKINETNNTALHEVFYQLIENETRTIMLAEGREGYALDVIDPAVVPEEKSGPKRAIICLIFTFIGLFVGGVLAIGKYMLSPKSEMQSAPQ